MFKIYVPLSNLLNSRDSKHMVMCYEPKIIQVKYNCESWKTVVKDYRRLCIKKL